MAGDRDERIRKRAHEIWESEGRPEGAHHEHWLKASSEVDAEDAAPAEKPKAAKASPRKPRQPKAAAAEVSKPAAAPRTRKKTTT